MATAMAAATDLRTGVSEAEYKKLASKLLVRTVDMTAELTTEAVEIITTSVEKHAASKNYEAIAQMIKNNMDKKCGAAWHCAIGEGFGFDVTYQQQNMIYVFFGSIGILCYKC